VVAACPDGRRRIKYRTFRAIAARSRAQDLLPELRQARSAVINLRQANCEVAHEMFASFRAIFIAAGNIKAFHRAFDRQNILAGAIFTIESRRADKT
jgi:hypothetical protein